MSALRIFLFIGIAVFTLVIVVVVARPRTLRESNTSDALLPMVTGELQEVTLTPTLGNN